MSTGVLTRLLASDEPTIRYRTRVALCGEDPAAPELRALQQAIAASPRVQTLLSERGPDGRIPHHPYQKWSGAHWVLADLAELAYPPGDPALASLLDDEMGWLLSPAHLKKVRILDGRARRCASQEGNAVLSAIRLGLYDARVDELVARLLKWQWPDGGWNCDKRPAAHHSSFMESLIPLRALVYYARLTGMAAAHQAAERAAGIFLKRQLFRRLRDGAVMNPDFTRLHYPCYWHYDILAGLKVMAEAGAIADPRCQAALDLLESKRLADGSFPAEASYYRVTTQRVSGRSLVSWGGTRKTQGNEFVTVDALTVLAAAGRLPIPSQQGVPSFAN
ncbi:MAG: hypothetical protein DCC57_16005 [Chloroflexi bacterium]|nr:MAG: hypothetical protein DCC57_16005 [Chloroflexota bacterium]